MRKIIISLGLVSQLSYGADFTVQFQPEDNSINDSKISSITSSKISDFATSVLSSISSTLSGYLLKSEIKTPTTQKLTSSGTYTTPAGVKYIKVTAVGVEAEAEVVLIMEQIILMMEFLEETRFLEVSSPLAEESEETLPIVVMDLLTQSLTQQR